MILIVTGVVADNKLQQALNLGLNSQNLSREDCIWRRGLERDPCPDPNMYFYLYTPNR